MARLVHHHVARVEQQGVLGIRLVLVLRPVTNKAKHACPLAVVCPTEDVVPAISWVEVLHCYGKHGIGILGDEALRVND